MLLGGVLGIYVDFINYWVYQLCCRINVLLYLNECWQDEYEGYLEFWIRDMFWCVWRICLLLGCMVIFNIDVDFFYGSLVFIVCFDGCICKFIVFYYYING